RHTNKKCREPGTKADQAHLPSTQTNALTVTGVNKTRTGQNSGRGSMNERPIVVTMHDIDTPLLDQPSQCSDSLESKTRRHTERCDAATAGGDVISQDSPRC